MGSIFDQLPPELFVQIISHLGTARALINLSLTCKRIHAIIEKDGFRTFVQSHFPSFEIPPYWKDAAHAMTTLSRNWDRKSFVAQWLSSNAYCSYLEDSPRFQRPNMGFQPIIDSYDQWTGNHWSSRRQVVTWAAGSNLVLRLKLMGKEAKTVSKDATTGKRTNLFIDQHHHVHVFTAFRDNHFKPGQDDISSVNLLRPTQKLEDNFEYVVAGRASGALSLITFSMSDVTSSSRTEFDTRARSVRDATINEEPNPLLAACLSARDLALYSVHFDDQIVTACDEITVVPSTEQDKIWSCRFLRHNRLALGLGPSKNPIHVYEIEPSGFSEQPVRKFTMDKDDHEGADAGSSVTSVYPIVPITAATSEGGSEGNTFLSGGYDGIVRLHDLRSPAPSTAMFTDPVDGSSIYSLASFGCERFIAGASRHCLVKVFDLRLPGGKVYYAADLDPCSSNQNASISSSAPSRAVSPFCCQYHRDARWNRHNYNLFLMPKYRRQRPRSMRKNRDGPVYSLSSPSPCSPTVFAGVENNVLQIDVVSVMDRDPDPIYQNMREWIRAEDNVVERWDPQSAVINMCLYEHRQGTPTLKEQQQVDYSFGFRKGWDARWV